MVLTKINPESAFAAVDVNSLHRRMGHIGMDRLQQMVTKGRLQNIDTLTGTPEFCEPCALEKMKKLPFKSTGGNQAKNPIQIVHTDVGGPIKPTSREGFWY
ncbi:hypothetical protein SERLADRAFT_443547 [Serpula lacrymans var. lacrymans S7.9]|uniref:GAG-pre-integrase domain-containing protein n=1 Tax=Serpula lacrymans var. lacrymans (strain S7.9) TaxID=578457 RepID=F8PCQ5_SERL9|nr:uncharacterized protein SERLADRAFT_443547 [Serpula lacrymans var. lacrymans S7.9]EGO19004.1 hypothetical protein SERLADRAFT_443547 [Serpula lacrymans var. lacrymans S7.9]